MKRKLKILILMSLMVSANSYAKIVSGIYMSAADYKSGKLTYDSDNARSKTRIYIHDFFWNMPGVKIISDGKKYAYKKSELYGFRDQNNNVYRFYDNTKYRIAEAGKIYIYVQERNIAQSKGYKVVNAYYFSTTPNGNILPVSNLKNVYRSNDTFCDLLDQYFGSVDVAAYDVKHATFRVNYVYSKSIK